MPYSLILDGSNDTDLSEMFPITVRVFDINFSRVMTKFFDMNLTDGTDASTTEAIFQSVNNQLSNHDISWNYCLAIALDRTNVNVGDHNSIKFRAKEQRKYVIPGCQCHILHNVSCKAGEMFSQ